MKPAIIALLIPLLSLTACFKTTASSSPVTHRQETREAIAPDVIKYPLSTRQAIVQEIKGGQCNQLTEIAKDYKVMRDQSRAIKTFGQ